LSTLAPLYEVFRSYNKLVWSTGSDAFIRYLVHCCCRFHSVVSYSACIRLNLEADGKSDIGQGKDVGATRLTYLLKPDPTRSRWQVDATPPTTDYDSASSVAEEEDDSTEAEFEAETTLILEDYGCHRSNSSDNLCSDTEDNSQILGSRATFDSTHLVSRRNTIPDCSSLSQSTPPALPSQAEISLSVNARTTLWNSVFYESRHPD
jgi:hypothetical protein